MKDSLGSFLHRWRIRAGFEVVFERRFMVGVNGNYCCQEDSLAVAVEHLQEFVVEGEGQDLERGVA